MEEKTRQPKQKRSIQTKEMILSTAKQLFSDKGYFNVTTNEIAKEAGVSIGSLYSYFTDKDTILKELLELHNQHFLVIFDEVQTEFNTTLLEENREQWFTNLFYRLIDLHLSEKQFAEELNSLYYAKEEVKILTDSHQKKIQQMLLTSLEENKHLVKSENLEATSLVLLDCISAVVDRIVFKQSVIDSDTLIQNAVDMILGGV